MEGGEGGREGWMNFGEAALHSLLIWRSKRSLMHDHATRATDRPNIDSPTFTADLAQKSEFRRACPASLPACPSAGKHAQRLQNTRTSR